MDDQPQVFGTVTGRNTGTDSVMALGFAVPDRPFLASSAKPLLLLIGYGRRADASGPAEIWFVGGDTVVPSCD